MFIFQITATFIARISIGYNLPPPQKNNYCSKQYYLMLIGGIQRLIIYGPFIDGDFRQYTEDGKSRYSLMYFPKKIDYQNFTDWELQFNVVKTWTKDEMSEKLSQIHSILSKLRYSLRQ